MLYMYTLQCLHRLRENLVSSSCFRPSSSLLLNHISWDSSDTADRRDHCSLLRRTEWKYSNFVSNHMWWYNISSQTRRILNCDILFYLLISDWKVSMLWLIGHIYSLIISMGSFVFSVIDTSHDNDCHTINFGGSVAGGSTSPGLINSIPEPPDPSESCISLMSGVRTTKNAVNRVSHKLVWTSGRTSGHQNLVSIFPGIDDCLKAKR